jgi:CMP-N,N'-diacetyllegionaminic acid synthase
MLKNPTCIAFIPARSGSKRVKNKNIRLLKGHPLIAYTIAAAKESQIFSEIIVSTDNKEIKEIAKYYGAEVPVLRPKKFAHDLSPDIEWIKHILEFLRGKKKDDSHLAILRPTSPFRQANTIKRAWKQYLSESNIDSLRAVEKCRQHPAKMWLVENNRIKPVMIGYDENKTPWHSKPYQALPVVYVQNASLEITKAQVIFKKNTISGEIISPFITENWEGYDINDEKDWFYAEKLLEEKKTILPFINKKPYRKL